MNNTKLEVVRINEDVIATSGVCTHTDKDHAYIYEIQGDQARTYYYTDKATYTEQTCDTVTDFAGIAPSVGKWYYLDGQDLKECTGSHSDYTVPKN